MKPNYNDIEKAVQDARPAPLTPDETQALMREVSLRMRSSMPSPYTRFLFVSTKTMIPLALIIAVLLGGGVTVAASDDARPGDFLFPVDRAVEDFRLALSSDKDKEDLRIKFADERLREFDSIVDEEIGDTELTGALTEAEADIFTNETIVKLEAGDKKVYFSTDADTREEIIQVIVDGYGYTEAEVDAVLVIETEDRESRETDRGLSEEGRARLEHALTVLNTFVSDTLSSASTSPGVLNAISVIEEHLQNRAENFSGELRAKVRDDKARFEIRNGTEKVRVEIKDGEVRIKSDSHDDDDDGDDESRGRGSDDDDSDDDGDRNSSSGLEIEADVFTDITLVKVEQNDKKTSFSTSADTRAEIIAEILTRYPLLTTAQIDSALELEIEDRASRADDSDEDSDDDSDDDSGKDDDDDDSDNDEDDDSSGKGSDDD